MRLMAIWLAIVTIGIPAFLSMRVRAESPYYYEHSWVFNIQENSDVEVTCSTVIHPSVGSWSESGMNFGGSYTIEDFRAYDETSGSSLRVDVKKSGGWTNCTVYYSRPQGDGYKFRVEYRATRQAKITSSGLSLDWSWGGNDKPLPQVVRVILPLRYDILSVSSSGKNLDYTKSGENGRIVTKFEGTAPAKGYFGWTATAQYVSGLVVHTVASATVTVERTLAVTTTVSTGFLPTGYATTAATVVGWGLVFLVGTGLGGLLMRSRTTTKPSQHEETLVEPAEPEEGTRHYGDEDEREAFFLAQLEKLRRRGEITEEVFRKIKDACSTSLDKNE